MEALVTGSSGVLGYSVVRKLVERRDQLRLFDMVETPPALRAYLDESGVIDFREYRNDMREREALDAAADGVEVIYHLAAGQRMKPQFSALSEEEIFDMNLEGLKNVLDVARSRDVRKVVFISSSGVYGLPEDRLIGESDHPTVPLGAYGHSKLQAETLCLEAMDAGLDVTMLRPMSLFGPGMTGVFVLLFDWVRRGRRVFLLGDGVNRVQMASADDVATAAIQSALRPESAGCIFNIGSDPATVPTVKEQVRALIDHAGANSAITTVPASLLRNAARGLNLFGLSPIVPEHYLLADRNFVLDISRAQEILDWKPESDNIRMTCDAYDWYCENWEAVAPKPNLALKVLESIT